MKKTNVKIASKMQTGRAAKSEVSLNVAAVTSVSHCFVCDEEIPDRGISLLMGFTAYSKTGLPAKIGQLIGEGFMVVVSVDDVLCKRCNTLLNYLDKLEVNVEIVKNALTAFLRVKYHLAEEDSKNNVVVETNVNTSAQLETKVKILEDTKLVVDEEEDTKLVEYESDLEVAYSSDENDTTKKVNVEIVLDKKNRKAEVKEKPAGERANSKIYKCKSCDFKTAIQSIYETHATACNKKPFKCSMCDKKFDTHKGIRRHVMDMHLSKWTCYFCNMNFSEEDEFTSHMKTHLSNTSASEIQNNNSNVKNVSENTNIRDVHRCNICAFVTDDKKIFDNHIRKHVVLKLYQCRTCGKRFEKKRALKDHASKCLPFNSFTCEMCSSTFETENDFILHMQEHVSYESCTPGQVINENAEQTTNGKLELPNFGETVCNSNVLENLNRQEIFMCMVCSQTFNSHLLLSQHTKLHLKDNSTEEKNTHDKNVLYKAVDVDTSSVINTENLSKEIDEELRDILFEKIVSKSNETFIQNSNESEKSLMHNSFQDLVVNEKFNESFSEIHKTAPKHVYAIDESVIDEIGSNSLQPENSEESLSESLEQMVQHMTIPSNAFSNILEDSSDNIDIMCAIPSKEEQLLENNVEYIFEGTRQTVISATSNNLTVKKDNQQLIKLNPSNVEGNSSTSNVKKINKNKTDCSVSGYPSQSMLKLKQHNETKNKVFKCHICFKELSSSQNLFSHLRKHEDDNDLTCPICFVVFNDDATLQSHMCDKHLSEQSTNDKVIYQCNICNINFSSKKAFLVHKVCHSNTFIYKCDECNLQFYKEKLLIDHKDSAHRDPCCRFCGKVIAKAKTLRNHELRHLREKDSYECDICKRIFKTKTGLRHHVAVHTGEYRYCCDFCGRGFMSRMMMEEHRSMHTKEERYVCDVCGRKFSFQSTYWIHRKWHDNPYPYKCSFCQRKFRHSSLLAVHKRKHTGERPYKCPHCPLSFPVGGTLKRHLILHTGVYPFNCDNCKRGFTTRHKYATHLAKVHGDFDMLQKKPKQKEFKMVIKNNEKVLNKVTSVNASGGNKVEPVDLQLKLVDENLDVIPCTIVSDATLVDNILETRVVEIVLNDSSEPVATVTLAQPGNNTLPQLWYHE